MPILYDQFGREIPGTKKPETRTMAAVSINDRSSEYPSDGLTPLRLAMIFKEADQGNVLRQAELFEEMEEKDAHLSAELLKRKNAINSVDFDIIPYAEGAKTSEFRDKKNVSQDKVCDACRDLIFSMPSFEDSLFDLLDAIGKGYAMSEIHWDYSEGQSWITGLSWIHQKRVTFNNSITPLLITDGNLMGEEIPPWKTVYHRHKARSGYDTRAGILRICGWMYLFKNYAIKDWTRFMELFGIPMRIGKYDPSANNTDKEALKTAIRSLGSAAAGIISKSTEIEFIEAVSKGGSSQNPFQALANFCDAQMSKAILGGTLTSDAGDKGSRSLGEVHNEVRRDIMQSDGNSLDNTVRMQILRPFVGFNFGWDVPAPWFKHDLREPEDLKTRIEQDKIAAVDIGIDIDDDYWRDTYGYPKPQPQGASASPEEPVKQEDQPDGDPGETRAKAALKNEPGQEEEAALDMLGAKVHEEADLEPIVKPLEDLLAECNSLEEFRDRMIEAYKGMDAVKLADVMRRGFVLADLAGRFDAS